MIKHLLSKVICSAALFTSLAACGGSGGGDSTNTNELAGDSNSTVDYPVSAAMTSFFSQSSSYTTYATVGNNTYTYTIKTAPRPDEVIPKFSSVPLKSYISSDILQLNNNAPEVDTNVGYYSANPFSFWAEGFMDDQGDLYLPDAPANRTPMPVSARIGQAGTLGNWSSGYLDQNNQYVEASDAAKWSLENASSNTAWLCLIYETFDVDGAYISKRCIEINKTGTAVRFKADFTGPGINYSFR